MTEDNFVKYLTFGALVIYFLLGLESIVARGMLMVLLAVSVICFIKSSEYWKRPVIMSFIMLLLLNTLYYLLSEKTVRINWGTTGFFANVFINMNIFFFSYYFSLKGRISEKELKCLFFALFIACTIKFIVTRDLILIERNGRMETMNFVYNFVVLMPYLYLFKHRIITILLFLPIAYFVSYGGKRGAILLFLIAAIIITYNIYLRGTKRYFTIKVILVAIVFILGYQIMYKVYEESSLLQWRLEMTMEGDANGRETIYGTIWDYWLNSSNMFRLIFGYGFCSSVELTGNYAHNDWLELLSMSGLVGIGAYLWFFSDLFFETRRNATSHKDILILISILWFAKSCFSMCIYSIGCMPFTLLLGYLIGNNIKTTKLAKFDQ